MEQQLIENKILTIREQKVILDSDVAELYGVETKRINEAVKNNPDKFPEGYILYLSMDEANSLRSKISTLKNLGRGEHFKYSPKAFSERAPNGFRFWYKWQEQYRNSKPIPVYRAS